MALRRNATTVDTSIKSIAMFTLRTQNAYKPGYKPNVRWVEVVPVGRASGRKFKVDRAHDREGDAFEYLVSVDVEPGTHTLRNVMGQSIKFLISGSFLFPVDGKFDVPADSVTYIGHVSMVNRKRENGERRSGSVIPLVDQAASGYAGGTFDITVSDRSATDIPLFTKTYPCLRELKIGTAVMQR